MALEDVSKFALVSVVLSNVAFLAHIIGFGAPFWTSTETDHSGLWNKCSGGRCTAFVGNPITGDSGLGEHLKDLTSNKYIANLLPSNAQSSNGLRLMDNLPVYTQSSPFRRAYGDSGLGEHWKDLISNKYIANLLPSNAGQKRVSPNIGPLEHLDLPGLDVKVVTLLPPHLLPNVHTLSDDQRRQKSDSSNIGSMILNDALLQAAQAFETLAFLVLFATLVMLGLRFTIMKENKLLPKLTIGSQFGAVALILIGVIIYAAKIKKETETYGYAFAFVIESVIISFVAGVFNVLDYKYSSDATPQ